MTIRFRKRILPLVDMALLFLFAAALIWPLFQAKYLDRWDSIESTFIADGRFLKDHGPHPQWQPLWYCGTRYDYLYPPVIRYGTALLSRVFVPAKAYHVFTALLYALGIAGVYLLVRVIGRSRGAAWLAALASALASPAYLFLPKMRTYFPDLVPIRLWVLTKYGEGPHASSLSILPFALAFSYRALERWRPAALAAAGVLSALVALTNFYGATALAIFYPILVWSVWVGRRERQMWVRAAAIPALAYGLSAFWLSPSYLRITVRNLALVSAPGHVSPLPLFAVVGVFGLASWMTVKDRKYTGLVFAWGSLLVIGWIVLGYVYFQASVTADPNRLVPELDLALILLSVELLRRLWNWNAKARAAAALTVAAAGAFLSGPYLRNAWKLYPREHDYKQRVEYRMSEWMASHLPASRAFVIGSIRLWWDTWHDLAEVGGGSNQGILNPYMPAADWQIIQRKEPELCVWWLTAMGADAVIVTDRQSQEVYHDFPNPRKFAGVLPVLYDDGAGNVVYQVPRRYHALARVVDSAALRDAPGIAPYYNADTLQAYARVIEEGPDSLATVAWDGTDAMRVHARMGAGQTLLLQESYDPAWHAYWNGKPVAIRPDPVDFMAIEAPPGEDDIRLVFEMPLENRIGWGLLLLSLGVVGWLLVAARRDARDLRSPMPLSSSQS